MSQSRGEFAIYISFEDRKRVLTIISKKKKERENFDLFLYILSKRIIRAEK